jgi:Flp pilus assembly CpaE family ATPase
MGDGRYVSNIVDQLTLAADGAFRNNLLDFEASFSDQLSGAARSEEPNIVLDQTFGEIQKASLVVDGQNGLAWSVLWC